jgi:hypothetical protein
MTSSVTQEFRQRLALLPAAVQEQAARAYARWRSDPYHNSLQFKRVSQDSRFTQSASVSATGHWGCAKASMSTGSGLAHTANMMSC